MSDIEMAGALPSIRLPRAGLLEGMGDLEAFQRCLASAVIDIEHHRTNAEVDLSHRVENRLEEFTGDHISARELIEALRTESAESTRDPEYAQISRSLAAVR